MNKLSKEQFYMWLVVTLVIINVGVIATIWIVRPSRMEMMSDRAPRPNQMRPPPPIRLEEVMKEELDFTDEQLETYRRLREDHQRKSKQVRDDIKHARESLYQLLLTDKIDSNQVSRLTKVIAEKQSSIEQNNFDHFQDIKKLCTLKQRENFGLLINELAQAMGPGQPPPPRPESGAPQPPK